ncbi:DUF1573 domain-containing protein [Pontibacter sp. SGAir0037]|uniref:DUF1573 domain-containing protein n=1 Tax=Pontibacter sp. SGAir0037 TaxID=2571030 RepID=UPI0010CD59B8|nr:DUF1573 domain-containing protein [Pontibacter sp. SGAir0037]QCR21710.1 hypothetical protein C1N53_04695 [Pontibacter sp. SGAir0037]
MIKKLYFLWMLCFLFAGFNAFAQGELKFEKELHDFGTFAEGIQASYEFRVKNVGTQPVVIANVQPSCGCTTPDWTKEPILPGRTGVIKAVYNSSGRPGPFHKSITVTSNAANPTNVLYIKGDVGAKDLKTSYTEEQKLKSPRLAVGSTNYNFGKLEKGQKAVAKFIIKNTGRTDLIIQGIKNNCNCISYRISEPALKPGQQGILELMYKPSVLNDQNEVVTVLSNDIIMPDLRLTLKATVVESLVTKNMIREGAEPVPFK